MHSVSAPRDGSITVNVQIDPSGNGPASVDCTFPATVKADLLRLNKGDRVDIDGTATTAKYELNGEITFTINGHSSTTKILDEDLDLGDCKLIDARPAPAGP